LRILSFCNTQSRKLSLGFGGADTSLEFRVNIAWPMSLCDSDAATKVALEGRLTAFQLSRDWMSLKTSEAGTT